MPGGVKREAQDIAERKKTLAAMLANVAELGAERMEETISKASLRDAAIGTGIAVDKMLALTGQTPAVQIANIVLPTEEERAERRRTEGYFRIVCAFCSRVIQKPRTRGAAEAIFSVCVRCKTKGAPKMQSKASNV